MKKDKYLQIFNYLLEFSKLRSNPVRDIESSETQYPDKVWFADIPQYDIFDSITFPNFNQDADYWLKITKPKNEPQHPAFPKLNEPLSEWVEKSSLLDENGTPKLKETISKDGKNISITERLEIEEKFETYLNEKWIDDLSYYKKQVKEYESRLAEYEKQSKTYKHLFSIYNKTQQFGEEYELIVGVGLLHFQESANTPLICRHIFTSKAEITFEFSTNQSFVKVFPSIDNEIQIETDAIIDLIEQFDSSDIIDAEKKVLEFLKEKNITDNPFDAQVKEAIQIFADRIRTDGQSKDDLEKSKNIAQKPTVYFAPALLLRKRNTRSFTALYEKIIETISSSDDTIDIPSINDIIGYFENTDNPFTDGENEPLGPVADKTIYFPKKYNDEQIEIIEKSRRNKKVLVQGPPGTGKSHTIANLICHLLANGKKVLITAYTQRALEVLKNQLPPEFQNLTVNLLSGDSASIQDLDASVNAINDELSRTNIGELKKEIERLEIDFANLKAEKAETKNKWLQVKEKSIRRQEINQRYSGSLTELAERIEKEHPAYAWFKDEFSDVSKLHLITEIENLYPLTRKYENIDSGIFNLIVPQKDKLLSIQELTEYRKIANILTQKYSHKGEHSIIKSGDYVELRRSLQELHKLLLDIEGSSVRFKEKLIDDYKTNLYLWKDKIAKTNNFLQELSEDILKQHDRNVEITYPENKSLIQLKNDGQILYAYLKQGNALSGVAFNLKKTFLSANIKERLYFIEGVKVNGSNCDTTAEFETVFADIKIKQDFDELERIWGIQPNSTFKTYADRAKFYGILKEDTEGFIDLLSQAHKLKIQIQSVSSIRIQNYNSSYVATLIDDCDYSYLLNREQSYKEKTEDANRHLSLQDIHPISSNISTALKNIDTESYDQLFLELERLNEEKEKFFLYKKQQETLSSHFPELIAEILDNSFEISNFRQLENAIHYKHALSEIIKILGNDYETELTQKLSALEYQEEKLISLLASKKAWLNVLESLSVNFLLRQHLQAWVQAVKKIGKTGTGKRALKFRKEAQHQMEKCKDSVPCWIMPLYKVAETINPEQEIYDYVIIDEASQLGADAIFLLYISKNIIIVGDDKQTSPEYVGVDANTMTPHINRHLQDIPFKNYYGTEFSFFDHAKRFCNGMTVLREHFRCMPEIIEFCNKHFYAPDGKGLYPLKQYSETHRLNPTEHIYCSSGYVDGTYQNIINKVEAEAIANKISELVNDEKYKGKSFGVIGLQGNRQAALIETLIIKKIGEVEFKKRKIVCGNSASFQGDERDIMFLSLVTAHNHNRSALTKPEDERRFNVAVSRAKEQVWLFHSIQLEDLSNTNDLRYKLLDHFLNYKPQPIPPQKTFERTFGAQPEPFESWFEVDVYNDIVANNYSVIPQYEVAKGKYRIDLVALFSNGKKIAIECDGDKFHSAEQFQNDLLRQRVLERCGWQFVRIRGAEYYSNRQKALEPLWKKLRENDIQEDEEPEDNYYSQNGHGEEEKVKDEENIEETQAPTRRPATTSTRRNTEQPDLFSRENQTTLNFNNETAATNTLRTSADLFSSSEILVFTSNHNVYKVQNRGFTNHTHITLRIEFEEGENPIYFTGTRNFSGYLIVGFQNGKVGKISMQSFQTEHNRKKLKNAYNDESKLIFIEHIEEDIDLVALSSINKVVLFNTNKINPVDSRITKGIQVMKPKDGSDMKKLKKLSQVKLQDPEYYRKDESLNVVGYYLKQGDEI